MFTYLAYAGKECINDIRLNKKYNQTFMIIEIIDEVLG